MGLRERNELVSRVIILIAHLLKWQPGQGVNRCATLRHPFRHHAPAFANSPRRSTVPSTLVMVSIDVDDLDRPAHKPPMRTMWAAAGERRAIRHGPSTQSAPVPSKATCALLSAEAPRRCVDPDRRGRPLRPTRARNGAACRAPTESRRTRDRGISRVTRACARAPSGSACGCGSRRG